MRRAGASGWVNGGLAITGGLVARGLWCYVTTRDGSVKKRWERINHRGEPVTLLQGPVVAVAGALTAVLAPQTPARVRAAGVVAALGAGAFGVLDDLAEQEEAKGLKGHLAAARRGEITTGFVKIVGIGATGVVAAALALPDDASRVRRAFDILTSGAEIAAAANVVNLLDLRPGRATKVVLAHAPAMVVAPGGALVAAAVGPAAALLPEDLAEQSMLGDAGANALGALLGAAVVSSAGRPARLALLAVHTALILASEKVSFTRVIERTPVLRDIDSWGRRPRTSGQGSSAIANA